MFGPLQPYAPFIILAMGAFALYLAFSGESKSASGPSFWSRLAALWPASKGDESTDEASLTDAKKTPDELDLAALDRLRNRGKRRKSDKIAAAVVGVEAVYFDQGTDKSEAAA